MHQGHGPAQRMVEVLGEHDVPSRLVETDGSQDGAGSDGVVLVTRRGEPAAVRAAVEAVKAAGRDELL
jgi:hypothetical protein